MLWLLETNNVPGVPSKYKITKSSSSLHLTHGIRTRSHLGAFGNLYYVNSIADIISQVCHYLVLHGFSSSIITQEMANPHVRPHLRFYPEDSAKVVNEYWQAKHWREEVDADRLTPMAEIKNQHFFTFEPCLLDDGSVCMPVRWFHRAGVLFAQAWTLRQVFSADRGSWVVEEYNQIEVPQGKFLVPFDKWDTSFSTRHLPHAKNISGNLCDVLLFYDCSHTLLQELYGRKKVPLSHGQEQIL